MGRRDFYVTPDLSHKKGGRKKRRAKIMNGLEKNKEEKT